MPFVGINMQFSIPKLRKKVKLKQSGDSLINIKKGENDFFDVIAPAEVNLKNPAYIGIDSMYISGLIVTNYNRQQEMGWITPLFNLDFDADISMFYEKLDSAAVIRELTYYIGNINTTMRVVSKNQQDIDLIETSYEDAKYIRREIQVNKEDLYRLYIYISVFGEKLSDVNFNLQKLEGICASMGMQTRRAMFRQEQTFKATLPLHINEKDISQSAARNVLSAALTSTYPFVSSELYDKEGIVIGNNEHNRSIVVIDRFDSNKYKNANMCVLGTSGAGKSFFVKLMILRNRLLDIDQFVIDPDREYGEVCKTLEGLTIKIGPKSETYINIFDIRENNMEDGSKGYLADRISRLQSFFSLIFTDITKMEKVLLEEKLIECYKNKGITFDDESLYKQENGNKICIKKIFKGPKEMPILEDLYKLLADDENTKKLSLELKQYVSGSLAFLNKNTNIDLNNKLIVADIHDLDDNLLPLGMFIAIDIFWDKIKEKRNKKKIIYMDELWRLMGSTGNCQTAAFVHKIFKTIRKYGGGATGITQDVSDFFALEGGKYGKAIVNNSALKFILQLEEEDTELLKKVLNLSEEEEIKIKNFERGTGLLYAGKNHVAVKIKAFDEEYKVITTDRKDLEEYENEKQMKN